MLAADFFVQTSVYLALVHRLGSAVFRQFPTASSLGCFDNNELISLYKKTDPVGIGNFQKDVSCADDPVSALQTAIGTPGSCPLSSYAGTITVYRYFLVLRENAASADVLKISRRCKELLDSDKKSWGGQINFGPFTKDRAEQNPFKDFRTAFCTLSEPSVIILRSEFPLLIEHLGPVVSVDFGKPPVAGDSTTSQPIYCHFKKKYNLVRRNDEIANGYAEKYTENIFKILIISERASLAMMFICM